MNGALEIRNLLKVDPAVLAIVGTSSKIAIGIISPDSWGFTDSTCLIYRSGIRDNTLEYYEVEFTVNCRATKEYLSENLKDAVVAALNRVSISDGILKCTGYPVIPPVDDTDNYNTPVAVRITGK